MHILINLLSDQTIPNLIAIRECRPDRVVALTTEATRGQVERFATVSGLPHEAIDVRPYDVRQAAHCVEQTLTRLPAESRVTLNFTGGTKLMAIGSVLAATRAAARSIELLYINTPREQCERYRWTGGELAPVAPTPFTRNLPFADIVRLAGERIKSAQTDPDLAIRKRHEMTAWCLTQCGALAKQYGACFSGHGARRRLRQEHAFALRDPRGGAAGNVQWDAERLCVTTADNRRWAQRHAEPGSYIVGGWLEEYCYTSLFDAPGFDEVLMNVVLDLKEATRRQRQLRGAVSGDKNELDLVVMRGMRAALIECKAGNWGQDDLYKLHTLTQHLCGAFGTAFLVTTYAAAYLRAQRPDLFEKAADMHIHVIFQDKIAQLPELIAARLASTP